MVTCLAWDSGIDSRRGYSASLRGRGAGEAERESGRDKGKEGRRESERER